MAGWRLFLFCLLLPVTVTAISNSDIECSTPAEVIESTIICSKIHGDHDITIWFTNNFHSYTEKIRNLKCATGQLQIMSSDALSINLSNFLNASVFNITKNLRLDSIQLALLEVKSLEISSNTDLKAIHLSQLHTAGHLRINYNDKLSDIHLNALKSVKMLEIIGNPALKMITLPVLADVGILRIAKNLQLAKLEKLHSIVNHLIIDDNPQLEPLTGWPAPIRAEITKIPKIMYTELRRMFPSVIGEMPGWKIDCYLPRNTVIQNYADIYHCTGIRGANLILQNLPDDVTNSRLQFVEKDVILRKTEMMTTANFLTNVTVGGRIKFEGSHYMCKLKRNDNVTVEYQNEQRTIGCDLVSCKSLGYPLNCQIYIGDLILQYPDEVTLAKNLKYIHGRLIIKGTDLTSVEFPNLEEITGFQVPLVLITKNSDLDTIKWPKLRKITPIGRLSSPFIEITKNVKMTTADFMPKQIKCTTTAASVCQFDDYNQQLKSELESEKILNIIKLIAFVLGNIVAIGLLVTGLIIIFKWGQLTKEGRKKRAVERREKEEEKMRRKMQRLQERREKRQKKEKQEMTQAVKDMEIGIRTRLERLEKKKLDLEIMNKPNPNRSASRSPAAH